MKKLFFLVLFANIAWSTFSQCPGTSGPLGAGASGPDWVRGGNIMPSSGAPFGNYANIIGTRWTGACSQMWFTTGIDAPAVQYRMMINSGGNLFNDGRIGMGNYLPANFSPKSRLHLHQSDGKTSIRFTLSPIASTIPDGFEVGKDDGEIIPGTKNAFLWNYENTHMLFANNNIEWMRMTDIGRVGINTTTPGNRLEIASAAGDPYGLVGSGLKFKNLTCSSPLTPQCVPASPVFLSVDGAGNVILVGASSSSSTQIGDYCSSAGSHNPLTDNYEIPMADKNIYYPGQGFHAASPTTDAIGVGYACVSSLPAKFSVLQDNNLPVVGLGLSPQSTTAGSFLNKDISSGSFKTMTGIDAKSDGLQNPTLSITNIGGSFFAANGMDNRAVQGRTGNAPSTGINYAGHFTASSATSGENFGVLATGANGINNNYGIRASAGGGTNSYGIYASDPSTSTNHWAGYFDGNVNIVGSGASGTYALNVTGSAFLSSGTLWTTSDKNYKKDIKQLQNISGKLQKLNGYTYNFKTAEFPEKKFEDKEQIGLIAQELKEVFPQLVTTDEKGFMAVNYQGMIPVLVEAFKEQQKELEELKTLVRNNSNANTNVSGITLSDVQAIVLEQNVPNPFAEQTSIAYVLPIDVQKAQVLFYNAEGKLVNSSNLRAVAGRGMINVFANDLSSGIYSYVLIVDGKIIDSKKMVKQ